MSFHTKYTMPHVARTTMLLPKERWHKDPLVLGVYANRDHLVYSNIDLTLNKKMLLKIIKHKYEVLNDPDNIIQFSDDIVRLKNIINHLIKEIENLMNNCFKYDIKPFLSDGTRRYHTPCSEIIPMYYAYEIRKDSVQEIKSGY